MSVSNNIKAKRTELKMTIEELSKATRISRVTLEKYEDGRLNIPRNNVRKIAYALRTTVAELQKEEDAKKKEKSIKPAVIEAENSEMEAEFKKNEKTIKPITIVPVIEEIAEEKPYNGKEEEIIGKYNELDDIGRERVEKFLNTQVRRCKLNKK